MNQSKIINLPTYRDERGILTVLEKQLDFEIKRIYWIYGADNQKRGKHKHKKNKQALVAINGSIKINIINNHENFSYILNSPSESLIIETEDWHEMEFSKNAILLVFASHFYDKNDYIYSKF